MSKKVTRPRAVLEDMLEAWLKLKGLNDTEVEEALDQMRAEEGPEDEE